MKVLEYPIRIVVYTQYAYYMFQPLFWPSTGRSITKDIVQKHFKLLYAFVGINAASNKLNACSWISFCITNQTH